MTQQQKQSQFNYDDLTQFLRDNPGIFQQHPELLENLNLADARGAPSLLERQVAALKNRINNFQSQHHQLIEVARENEQISDNFTDVVCQLIAFNNLSEFSSELPKLIRKAFEIDEVSFKSIQSFSHKPNEIQGFDDTLRRLSNNQASCDNRWPSNILSLFFSNSIKSAALIPMSVDPKGRTLGILALGSKDTERYNNDLGTAHLNRLGIMSGICLARLQPEA